MAMCIDIVTMYDMKVIIDVTPGLLAVFSLFPAYQPSFDYDCRFADLNSLFFQMEILEQ